MCALLCVFAVFAVRIIRVPRRVSLQNKILLSSSRFTTKSISFLGRMLSSPRPNLDHSIQILVDSRLVSSFSHPQKVSEVYLALLGLLYHVKSDNDQLRNARYVKETEIG